MSNDKKFPERLDRKTIYSSDWINLYIDKVKMPSGKIIEKYHQLDYPRQGTVILLVNEDSEILFIESLRYTIGKTSWELPGGSSEIGEDVLMTAKREVLEETGYRVDNLKQIYNFFPTFGMSNLIGNVFFANVKKEQGLKDFDKDEVRSCKWLSEDKVRKMIKENEIVDAFTLIPLLLYFNDFIENNKEDI